MSGAPEPFSLSPLLSLLPSMGSVARLEVFVSSLFARFEAVEALREGSESDEVRNRLTQESAMLRQILDWLAVSPTEGGADVE